MAALCRWFLVLAFFAAPRLFAATAAENHAFQVATDYFDGKFYGQAEKEFGNFVRTFTNSTRLPEAILLQAEARFEQTNYAGAIELLSAQLNTATNWADQYLFWMAEAHFKQGDYPVAADGFAKLIKDFPASTLRLEAGIEEAAVFAKVSEWPRVIELLQQTNGVFQSAVRTNAADKWVPEGYLLLSEAFMERKPPDYTAAEAALQPLAKLLLPPRTAWRWQFLLCRIQFAAGQLVQALENTTNLMSLAASAAQKDLQAQSAAFKADILERLGRPGEAIAAYTNNLAEGFPAERQRQALFKITELFRAQDKDAEAAQMLETFLARFPKAPSADLAWLTLGELRLRSYAAGWDTNRLANAITNAAAATNSLELARVAFEALARDFPQSPLFGKVQLELGWCFWLTGKWPESQKAFRAAVERLSVSSDQAVAYFKLADAQFEQKDFKGAITNYNALIQKFASQHEVETNLFERALYQIVQAAIAANDPDAATNAVHRIVTEYPNGFYTDRAVILAGQNLSRQGDPPEARKLFSEFLKIAPQASLLPQLQLAIVRTYERENNWTNAFKEYDSWLVNFPNHEARPRAEYSRAHAAFQAGDETNALTLFTNFVAHYPTNELAPLAQLWVADFYYRSGNPYEAEKNYQLLSLNWAGSELACQARMMAGRAAKERGSEDAKEYFAKLRDDTNCPTNLRFEALFALGDYWMEHSSTNKQDDYAKALQVFSSICDPNPTNYLAVLACGQKANCLLQWGQYEEASNAFQKVILSPHAKAMARSMARVGQAVILEKLAQPKTGPERTLLLEQARDYCLEVFYGQSNIVRDDEKPDSWWTQKAGLEAAGFAEKLNDWARAIEVYRQLKEKFPPLRAALDKKILRAEENDRSQKISRNN